MTRKGDDDFLARTEPLAEPRNGQGSSGYAEGLRRTRAGRRASRDSKKREPMRKAFVVGAGVMGATVVVAAMFTILVFAGLFTVSPGVGGGHRTKTLVQQPAGTPDPPAPSTTTVPLAPGDTAEADSSVTAAQSGRSPMPSSTRVVIPRTTAGPQAPALPSLNSSPSGAPVGAATTAPAGSPTCYGNSKKCHAGR